MVSYPTELDPLTSVYIALFGGSQTGVCQSAGKRAAATEGLVEAAFPRPFQSILSQIDFKGPTREALERTIMMDPSIAVVLRPTLAVSQDLG